MHKARSQRWITSLRRLRKAVIKNVNPQNAEGPSELRYSHLQAALCDELVKDLAAFVGLVFSSRVFLHIFWTLNRSANLSALGNKARSVPCGDVLWRVIGAVFCRLRRECVQR